MNTMTKEKIHEQFSSFLHFERKRFFEGLEHEIWQGEIELKSNIGPDKYKYSRKSKDGVLRLPYSLPACLRKEKIYVKEYFTEEFEHFAIAVYARVFEDDEAVPAHDMEGCELGGNDMEPAYIDTIRYGYVNNEKPCKTEITIRCGDFRYYFTIDKYVCPELFTNATVFATGYRAAAFSDETLLVFRPTSIYIKIDAAIAATIEKYGEDIYKIFYHSKFARTIKEDEEYQAILKEKKYLDSLIQAQRDALLHPGFFKTIVYCENLEYKIEERGTVCVFEHLGNVYKAKVNRTFSNPQNFRKMRLQIEGKMEDSGKITLVTIVPVDVLIKMKELGCSEEFGMRFADQSKHMQPDILKELRELKKSGKNMQMLGMQDPKEEKYGTVLGFAEAKDSFLLAPERYPEAIRAGVKNALKRIDRGGGQRTANQNVVSAFMSIPYDTLPRKLLREKTVAANMNKDLIACENKVQEMIRSYNAGESAIILDGKKGSGKQALLDSFAKHTHKETAFFPTTGNPKDSINLGCSRGFENGSEGSIVRSIIQNKGNVLIVFEDCDKAEEAMLSSLAEVTKGTITDLFLETPIPLPNKTFVVFVTEDADKLPDWLKRGVTIISMPEYTDEQKAKILTKISKEKGCHLQKEVVDLLVASSLGNGVADLISDLNKIISSGKKNVSVTMAKRILKVTDEFSFPFYASTESLLHYFRFHQEVYSEGLRERIKQTYNEWQEESEKQKKWIGHQLSSMIRLRDSLPVEREMTPEKIEKLKNELNESHYDMHEAKQATLRGMIAIENSDCVKALLFVGPAGCGKTSFCETLGRVFERPIRKISCTGLTSVSQLSGVSGLGGVPKMGKIAESLCDATTTHSILLFDEIDKMKEPSVLNAFYTLLDGNKNGFWDEGLETYINVSDILFCFTANSLEKIPCTILDRCETIKMHSYTAPEKRKIAQKNIIPVLCRSYNADVEFSEEAVEFLIDNYCLEAGVRDVYRNLEGLFTSMIMNKEPLDGAMITPDVIKRFWPLTPIREDWFPKGETPVGCVRILATSGGAGCLSAVQVSRNYLDDGIRITGNVDATTKESVNDALNLCAHLLNREKMPPLSIRYSDGGVKKVGFSAGVSNVVACMSFLLNLPVNSYYGMTGEIDNTGGTVYPIGGVQEKLQAALDFGLKTVFLPAENYRQLVEQGGLKRFKGVDIRPVTTVTEVLDVVFGDEWRTVERA